MSDPQRTIEAMQEWERCPDGTAMRSSNSDAPWIKGRDHVYAWYTTAKYTFEYQDGWIKHEGNKCPVDGDVIVEVLTNFNQNPRRDAAKEWLWGRVTHYRIIEEAKPVVVMAYVWEDLNVGGYIVKGHLPNELEKQCYRVVKSKEIHIGN